MITMARVQRGMYFDSITLMQVTGILHQVAGVERAAAVMATPPNLQVLADAGLYPCTGVAGTPGEGDVLLVARASDEGSARAALDAAEARLLRNTRETVRDGEEAYHVRQPRSLEEAARLFPQARVALISVPGMYAALETQQALQAGLHVFLFSDNVSLEEEVALKRLGRERGLLVMGPDCGTARLNGVGLGFVNVVPDGPVGIVGASGTGMQQVMCLLAQAGCGISQAIGSGGRDLSAEVGALTTLQGLRFLQEDPGTQVIVLVSKPPAPAVAARVLEAAASGSKPAVVIFVGADPARWQGKYGVSLASTLSEAASMAAAACAPSQAARLSSTRQSVHTPLQRQPVTSQDGDVVRSRQPAEIYNGTPLSGQFSGTRKPTVQPPYLAALFSGGTLCDEALHIWGERPGPVYSNIPLNPAWTWHEKVVGHYALDLGADEYTRGRPHPMIDPEVRLACLRTACADPHIGVILFDIVLGYCAHPDPAALYAPLIQQARQARPRLDCVISLCGTEDDPQVLSRQAARLRAAGAEVYTSNAAAALRCLELLHGKE